MRSVWRISSGLAALGALAILASACTSLDSSSADSSQPGATDLVASTASTASATTASAPPVSDPVTTATPTTSSSSPSTTTTTERATGPTLTRPDWLGTRVLPTMPNGFVPPQTTPDELSDRRLPTIDVLEAPSSNVFDFTINPFEGEPLARSTWREGCPVEPDGLRYLTVSFWGFDNAVHTGELVVAADQAEGIVGVFEQLFAARFPLEEMRIITPADLDAPPTGDSNNTGSFVCRAVTGGRRFSEHAFGLAIDVNPFHNPYIRDDVVLPELASDYLDRERQLPGMVLPGDLVVQAFADIGWRWGGNWNSLKDYQHFALNNR